MKTKISEYSFINKFTHDILNPSFSQSEAIMSFLSLCENKLNNKEKDLLKLALSYSNKIQTLIKIYDSINNLQTEKENICYDFIDISKIVKEKFEDYEIVLKYNKLKLKYSDTKPFYVFGDERMIKNVLDIIIMETVFCASYNTNIEINFKKDKRETTFTLVSTNPYMEFESLEKNKKKFNFQERDYAPGYYLAKEYLNVHYGRIIAENYPDDLHVYGFSLPAK